MKVGCTICADTIEDSFSAAPCGHTFHQVCLSQWLSHRKTCPQCRERCLPREVLKLFLDTDSRQDVRSSQLDSLSPEELMERVKKQDSLLKEKDEAIEKAHDELTRVRDEVEAWQVTNEATQLKLQREKDHVRGYKLRMQMYESEREKAEMAVIEAAELRKQLETLQNIQLLLDSSSLDTQQLVSSSSPTDLTNYVVAIKTEYESLKERKTALHKDKTKLVQETTTLRRKLRQSDLELQEVRSQLAINESDIQSLEQEKDSLHRKVELLERAIESPNSQKILKRILESPMPDAVRKFIKLDTSASPVLAKKERCDSTDSGSFQTATENKLSSSPKVLMPVQRVSNTENFTGMNAGYNGFGGQSSFAVPSRPPLSNSIHNKKYKFAPRQGGSVFKKPTSSSTSNRGQQYKQTSLRTKLKF